jgi:hypothetical protein
MIGSALMAAWLLTILAPVAGILHSLRGDHTPSPEGTRAEWRWIFRAFRS